MAGRPVHFPRRRPEVEAVKTLCPLLVLHHLATQIIARQLGDYSQESSAWSTLTAWTIGASPHAQLV